MRDWLISKENSKECRGIGYKEQPLALLWTQTAKEKFRMSQSGAEIPVSLKRAPPGLTCEQDIAYYGCGCNLSEIRSLAQGRREVLWRTTDEGRMEKAADHPRLQGPEAEAAARTACAPCWGSRESTRWADHSWEAKPLFLHRFSSVSLLRKHQYQLKKELYFKGPCPFPQGRRIGLLWSWETMNF